MKQTLMLAVIAIWIVPWATGGTEPRSNAS